MTDDRTALTTFRATHPCAIHSVDGVQWEAIACGHGDKTLLLLPGALGLAETSFRYIAAFEADWRVLSLSYPDAIDTVRGLVDGITELLAIYGVDAAYMVGGSYSGLVAQYLAAWQPACVAALLLSNTGAPDPHRGRRYSLLARLFGVLPAGAFHTAMRGAVRLFLRADTDEHRFWRAYFAEIIPHFSRRALVNRLRIQADIDRPANAAQWASSHWSGPTLIVDAGDDHLVAAHARAALRTHYPRARHISMHGRGHAASLDESTAYLRLYREFLCSL